MSDQSTETALRQMLDKLSVGEDAALNDFLQRVSDRLRALTRHMLRQFPGVRRWEDTDDVLQNSMVRLLRALRDVRPDSLRHFYGLASLQVRRELIDLARHYFGPAGHGANHASDLHRDSSGRQVLDPADVTFEPARLAEWCELHQHIDALPESEREVIDLVFYQGLTQQEAASLLEVNVRTIQRRWHSALLKLHQLLNDEGA